MPIEILMPALSPTMTEGTLAKWIKKEGDEVSSGDVIAEIETDKATMEVEAVDEGKLGKILIAEGTDGVAVNEIIALLLDDGEDASALDGYEAKEEAPAAETVKEEAPAPAAALVANGSLGERVLASPLAKRIAGNEGIDIAQVHGTGPHGRVIKADVEEAMANGAIGGTKTAGVSVGRNPVEYTEIPNNNMRKTIAKRLLESKTTVPHFYLTIECELDLLLAARKRMNEMAEAAVKETDQYPVYKISVNDMIIKAVAMGLRDVPEANASWTDAAIQQYNNVDLSVAVAIDGGLITPIIKNADQKSLSQISNEMKDLAKRARDGKLAPEEYTGGGFSISNLGMFGIKQFNAIINPPQSCILAVGKGEERVVVKNGEMKAVNAMSVALSCDHRVVDGAVGAMFLNAFQRYIEDPVTMLV